MESSKIPMPSLPCHTIHPFHETWQFSQSVRAHPAKLGHRVATRIPTESPTVRASIKLKITTVPSPAGWQLGGYFSAPRNGRTATVSAREWSRMYVCGGLASQRHSARLRRHVATPGWDMIGVEMRACRR